MTYSISRTVSKRGGRKEELNVCYVLVLQTKYKRPNAYDTAKCMFSLVAHFTCTFRYSRTVWISCHTQKENVLLLK